MKFPLAENSAAQAGRKAQNAVANASDNKWFEYVARIGYVMTGLVHAMIGWICLRLGLSGNTEESADQSGALAAFADAPAGAALLIIGGVAMAALALTHILDIFYGSAGRADKKASAIAKAIGKAGAYAALAFTAIRFGTGSHSSSGDSAESATEPFLTSTPGRVLVVVVGLVIVAIGVYHVYKGMTRKFREDLNPTGDHKVSTAIDRTGLVGYVAKGIALAGVGVMVMWAAISSDPEKARGFDAAFKEVLTLPAGGIILATIGVGFVLYGVYSVLRAKYQEM